MTTFRLWDPAAKDVVLWLPDAQSRPMTGEAGGWWRADVPAAATGSRYGYCLDGDPRPLPDPRSPRQPDGVHAPSAVYDHAEFDWTDGGWRGIDLKGAVLYELHVGTFTAAGTFDAIHEHLDHLAALGVDAIELLPCATFPGVRGWGYDGVALFAVHEPYGGPDGLKRLVDAAHARGIGVVMDVVYNHLGPEGNYLARFGPYFTDQHVTPWGPAVNLDAPGSDEVRQFLLDNAAMWLRDYHCDGLRLDAVHALADARALPLLEELAILVEGLAAQQRRPLFLIAESDLNDPRLVRPRQAGGQGLDAQWCDDVHHSLHATLTGERQGYYADFGDLAVLAKALTGAFVHDGSWSSFRGRSHGRPVGEVAGHRFVTFLQNHDQVGNRARGERLAALVPAALLRVAATLLLTAPFVPMLFMGEEWGACTPWQFFSAYTDPALARAVTDGRRAEFAEHGWDTAEVPDPQDPATRDRSVLNWAEAQEPEGAALLEYYRRLIALRRAWPQLSDGRRDLVRVDTDQSAGTLAMHRQDLVVVANLSAERRAVPVRGIPVEVLLASAPGFSYAEGLVELDGATAVVIRLLSRPVT